MELRLHSFGEEYPAILTADRAEVSLVAPDEREYTVILLDADDSFDVVIHNPNSSREIVWSLVKDEDAAAREQEEEEENDEDEEEDQ